MTAAQTILSGTSIVEVWHALGGGEIRHGRGQAFWRGGDGWSASIDDNRGLWFDHRDCVGGGILDLIQHVRGGTRVEALQWLGTLAGVRLDHLPERDRNAMGVAWRTNREAFYFARAAAEMAVSALESLPTEDPERAVYTTLLANLRTSSLAEYLEWRDRQPEMTAALVYAGRQHERRLQIGLANYVSTQEPGDAER